MRRLTVVLALIVVLALPVTVSAHPSENRNEQGFGGGPHCHFVLAAPEGTRAYPSHMAHATQLQRGPAGAVFAATACD